MALATLTHCNLPDMSGPQRLLPANAAVTADCFKLLLLPATEYVPATCTCSRPAAP
jgi:hypothetical protein